MDTLQMKRCPRCARDLPLEDFAVHRGRKDGRQTYCRSCSTQYRLVRSERDASASISLDPLGKRCPRCKDIKPWDCYSGNKAARDKHQSECKPCAEMTRREYRQRHSEALALRAAERAARKVDATATKACVVCGAVKPLLSFYSDRNKRDARSSRCAECVKTERRAWNAKNADRIRERNAAYRAEHPDRKLRDHRQWWLRLYDLTPDDYAQLLADQHGTCALCQKPERYVDSRTGEPRRLSVDHDHSTGRVRGLLCGRCNRALGQMDDDPATFLRAAEYLRRAID